MGSGFPARVLGFQVPDYVTIKEWDWELYWGDTGDWEKARKSLGIRLSSTPGEKFAIFYTEIVLTGKQILPISF